MSSTRKFNWKGISENYDGSFTVEDKRARRRLLKELHGQGFKVRSKKVEGDGYQLTPIGQGNFKAARKASAPLRSAARPRTAYSSYRRIPHRTASAGPRLVAYPTRPRSFNRPHYGAPPRVSGYGGSGLRSKIRPKLLEYLKKRNEKIQEEQKPKFREEDPVTGKVRFVPQAEHEINKKMRKERIEKEREETVKQLESQRLAREAREHEHRQAQERKAERHTDFEATRREHREAKPDNAKLAEARQEYVTGS